MLKLPQQDWKLELSMQQNEMFLLGLDHETIITSIQSNDFHLLGSYLYRMQKLSIIGNGQINLWFRHQYETELIDDENAKKAKRYYNVQSLGALFQLKPMKVRVSILGNIELIDQ
ncbi:MAG: hypothetical protein HC830_12470 [Bacteroidetes bacterium]|nr:hypothetical protein [Bacteroidota bacterium]